MHPAYFAGRRAWGLGHRLIWFGLGAFAASWWHKHHYANGQLCGRRPQFVKEREERDHTQSAPATYSPAARSPAPVGSAYPPVQAETESWGVDKFDRDRLRELGGQATDALADASESMLDSAFSTLEILRNRLREQRAEKERQQALKKESEDRRMV